MTTFPGPPFYALQPKGLQPPKCTATFTWPPSPGAIVPFGHDIRATWSITRRINSYVGTPEACDALCVTFNEQPPLCRALDGDGYLDLEGLVPGYHSIGLSWNGSEEGGAETWFHVSMATELGDEALSGRTRALLTDVGRPVSLSQYDEPEALAKIYMTERYNISSIAILSWREPDDPFWGAPVNFTGEKAFAALGRFMKKKLLLAELRNVATNTSAPGTLFGLQGMLEGRDFSYDDAAFMLFLTSEILRPDVELATALLRVMESAVTNAPSFMTAAHGFLQVAWLFRRSLSEETTTRALEAASRAVWQSITSSGPPLRRRGDPRRPVGDVMLITIATHSTPELELMRRSASAVGLELIVDDGGAGGEWLGFGNRVVRMRVLLEGVEDNTLVLHVDAFDTLFLPTTSQEIASKFLAAGADILFSAEANCAPDPGLELLYPGHLAAAKAFLNAGSFIGRASDVRVMLDEVIDEMQRQEDAFGLELRLEDDQRMFARYFLRHGGGAGSYADYARYGAYGGDHVALDVQQSLFLTLFGRFDSDVEISSENEPEGSGPRQRLLRYGPAGTTPFLLHGNGDDAKEMLQRLTDQLGVLGWPPPATVQDAKDS